MSGGKGASIARWWIPLRGTLLVATDLDGDPRERSASGQAARLSTAICANVPDRLHGMQSDVLVPTRGAVVLRRGAARRFVAHVLDDRAWSRRACRDIETPCWTGSAPAGGLCGQGCGTVFGAARLNGRGGFSDFSEDHLIETLRGLAPLGILTGVRSTRRTGRRSTLLPRPDAR